MGGEDIIEGLNRHIESKRKKLNIDSISHLVIQRTIDKNNLFKSYKTYSAILWFVNGRNKHKVLSVVLTDKVLSGQEDNMIKNINIQLCSAIFEWIETDYYTQVILGKYCNDAND